MKKRVLSAAVIVAVVAIVAGWNYQQGKTDVKLSDLALANVEALADGENGGEILYEGYCPRAGTQCRASAVTGPTCPYKWSCP